MTSARLTATLPLRILPPGLYARRSRAVLEREVRVYRRGWLVIFSGFFEPLFYLLSMGTGLDRLVGGVEGINGHPITYAAFIAPALLASSAMNGAIFDATFNVFFKLKHARLYDAMLATSLGPLDVAMGEIAWALLRGGIYSAAFLTVMACMGLIGSWWALMMLPAALLVAFAFAAIGMAGTTFMRTVTDMDLVQLAMLPMFLFSGTFYALSVYPRWLQIVVECLPLHHGIALMRALNQGAVDWSLLGHVAYLLAMAGVGVTVTARRLSTLLLK
jgi:lipooligosaccharide transport system permease protein